MLIKGYKLPVIKGIRSGALTYSMVTTVRKTVLYTQKVLREQISNVLSACAHTHTHTHTHTHHYPPHKGNYVRLHCPVSLNFFSSFTFHLN